MSLMNSIMRYFSIAGSTVQDIPGTTTFLATNQRRVRVDANGYLEVIGGGAGGNILIAGVAGDDTTLNSFRQVDFVPQAVGDGWRSTLTAVNQQLGALTVDKTHHITPSVDCWVLAGATGLTAVVGDNAGAGTTHLKAGATYEYIPRTNFDFIAFIKDTSSADGYIAISRVEA